MRISSLLTLKSAVSHLYGSAHPPDILFVFSERIRTLYSLRVRMRVGQSHTIFLRWHCGSAHETSNCE